MCALPRVAGAAASFEVKRLSVKGKHASRFDVLIPKQLTQGAATRVLIALHGLGESHDPELGAAAWVERYGLGGAHDRLLSPPVVQVGKRKDWTDGRLREVNESLKQRPFTGLVVACPFTPNFKNVPDRAKAIGEYGRWLLGDMLPLVRKEAKVDANPSQTAIDGCSMGGPFALDIFLANPKRFGAVGVVQPAFGEHRAPGYAVALAEAVKTNGARPIHLLSSEGDSFRGTTKLLAAELEKRAVPHTVRITPGPHDQPWLRESGTLEMLMFHAQR
jgi:hypothetical protein